MTEPALVGQGFIREEIFAQRSRSRLGTQEVKRILGRRSHLTKEGEGILGRVGVGRDKEIFHRGRRGYERVCGERGS